MLVLPNGDVIVAEQNAGHLTLLRAGPDGKAEFIERHAENFNKPYGLAWRDGNVFVADQDGICPYRTNSVTCARGTVKTRRPPMYRLQNANRRRISTPSRW